MTDTSVLHEEEQTKKWIEEITSLLKLKFQNDRMVFESEQKTEQVETTAHLGGCY